jgi:hypothetical protein
MNVTQASKRRLYDQWLNGSISILLANLDISTTSGDITSD